MNLGGNWSEKTGLPEYVHFYSKYTSERIVMAVRSKNFSKNHEFDFVCPFLHIKMPFIASNHTYYQRRYIPLHIETDFSPPCQTVSEYQHQS